MSINYIRGGDKKAYFTRNNVHDMHNAARLDPLHATFTTGSKLS